MTVNDESSTHGQRGHVRMPSIYLRDDTRVVAYDDLGRYGGLGQNTWEDRVRRALAKNPGLRHQMMGCPWPLPKVRKLKSYDIAFKEGAILLVFQDRTKPGRIAALLEAFTSGAVEGPWPIRSNVQPASGLEPSKDVEVEIAHQVADDMAAEMEAESHREKPKDEPKQEEVSEGEAIPPGDATDDTDDDHEPASSDRSPVVYNKDQETLTTSLDVARVYGKRHDNVLRAIDDILAGMPSILRSQFVFRETTYLKRGKRERMVEMNEEAFSLLVGGFTGSEALRFRVAYIIEFKRMQKALMGQPSSPDWLIRAERAAGLLVEENTNLKTINRALKSENLEVKSYADDMDARHHAGIGLYGIESFARDELDLVCYYHLARQMNIDGFTKREWNESLGKSVRVPTKTSIEQGLLTVVMREPPNLKGKKVPVVLITEKGQKFFKRKYWWTLKRRNQHGPMDQGRLTLSKEMVN